MGYRCIGQRPVKDRHLLGAGELLLHLHAASVDVRPGHRRVKPPASGDRRDGAGQRPVPANRPDASEERGKAMSYGVRLTARIVTALGSVALGVTAALAADLEIDRLLKSPVGKDWVANGGNMTNQR